MFDGQPYKIEFSRRIDVVRRLLDACDIPANSGSIDVTREARGLAVVLLFAAYENLVTSLCRGLLEASLKTRVGNRRLRRGLRLFAVFQDLQSIRDSSEKKIWIENGQRLIEKLDSGRVCTVNVDLFPQDGSFMKRSQISLFCELFSLGDPGPVLREVWARIDTVVTQRNGVAHGRLTPEEVGRNYSSTDIRALVDSWETRWGQFIDLVHTKASSRDFYRLAR
jgi:hypothetical protein